ncbi:MAG TPA: HAD-IIIA family hydrolase [Steroidobacteraceae bacterium]|nr:HAD-IIIA family hydrolase [Steroidobacteraceae bacterium]
MTYKDAAAIRLLVLDVDGVMTDGRLYFGPRGEALKVFHVRDGLGLQQLDAAGIGVAVISGRRSRMVAVRCRELGVEHVIQGARDKLAALTRLRSRLKVSAAECACVGDDATDVPLMGAVKLAFAVADAHREALRAAHVVTSLPGGSGAVREVCDYLLDARRLAARTRRTRLTVAPSRAKRRAR